MAEDGSEAIFSMGCYGMGVSRLLAVVAEEHHDDQGLAWPPEAAPYRVHLAALGAGRSVEVAEAADRLYQRLVEGGVEVLYDDRDVSPGIKFKDADLLGVPVRLVVGAKGLARGVVEWRSRSTGEERELAVDSPVSDLVAGVDPLVGEARQAPTSCEFWGENTRQDARGSGPSLLYF